MMPSIWPVLGFMVGVHFFSWAYMPKLSASFWKQNSIQTSTFCLIQRLDIDDYRHIHHATTC